MKNFTETSMLMSRAVQNGVFPSGSLLVASKGKVVFEDYVGGCSEDTIFDVASLTKAVVTTTLVMMAVSENLLSLDDEVKKFFPTSLGLSDVKVYNLLNHSSGLPWWQPYFREVPEDTVATRASREHVLNSILNEPLKYKTGEKQEYSDLDFILLGEILDKVFGKPVHLLAEEKIFKPLGLKNSFFRIVDKTPWSHATFLPIFPVEKDFSNFVFAPTEDCPWREEVVRGYVHDQNAYAMGGVSGHAGLFSTVSDINKVVAELVLSFKGKSDFVSTEVVKKFWEKSSGDLGNFRLGWDSPSRPASQSGRFFSDDSVGHLAYTGCSLWIDLLQDYWVILLTNRVHPSATNHKIKAFRPKIHDKIQAELAV